MLHPHPSGLRHCYSSLLPPPPLLLLLDYSSTQITSDSLAATVIYLIVDKTHSARRLRHLRNYRRQLEVLFTVYGKGHTSHRLDRSETIRC